MTNTFTIQIDGNKARTLRALYPRIAKALVFPDYFEKNLDALFDCLCDLSGVEAQYTHVTVHIVHASAFLSKEKPEKRAAALQVFQDATLPENRYDDRTFVVLHDAQ